MLVFANIAASGIFYQFLTRSGNLFLMSSFHTVVGRRTPRQKREREKEKGKTNKRRDIKGRENAGSYDNYEKGMKNRLGVRRLVK